MSNIFTNITLISDKPSLRKTESVMSNFNELKNDQLKNCELVHLKVWKRDGRVFKHRKLGFRIRTRVEEALSFGFLSGQGFQVGLLGDLDFFLYGPQDGHRQKQAQDILEA